MMENEMYDVLIIGSGPAGLGAAVYAVRAGLKAAVLDRSPVSGGQVQSTYEVDNYLGLPGMSGGDLSEAFRKHADALGAQFFTADVQGVEDCSGEQTKYTVHTDKGDFQTRTIIIATGASHSLLGARERRSLRGWAYRTAPPVTGHFTEKVLSQWLAAGMSQWRTPSFLRASVKKCISFTGETS